MKNKITNEDLLEAMNAFAENVDIRFEAIDSRLNKVESQMVTKDYLDRKLWGLQGDIVEMISRAIKKHELKMHAA